MIYSTDTGDVIDLAEGGEAQFSPDGKWIAHISQTSGLLVERANGTGGRIQIAIAGGSQARWSHDGKRLFYIQPDRKLMATEFDAANGTASTPRVVFQTHVIAPRLVLLQYDVASDGKFLINSFPTDASTPLTLLTGWTTLLKTH